MPRVEVLIRVLNDEGEGLARSTFRVGTTATNTVTGSTTPVDLAQTLGQMFVDALEASNPNIGFEALPGDLHVESTRDISPSEAIPSRMREQLTHYVGRPLTSETRAELLQEVGDFWRSNLDPIVIPLASQLEQVSLSEGNSAVSMGAAVHDALEGMYQTPVPPDESNPVSRVTRESLRAVVGRVGEDADERLQVLTNLYELGSISRRTLLQGAGSNENATQQELDETLWRLLGPPPPDRIRGRPILGAMLDDAADIPATPGMYSPQIIGDSHLARDLRDRHQARIETFQAIYGGDSYRSSGVETPSQPRAKIEVPKPSEERTTIPTRYQRKPVI